MKQNSQTNQDKKRLHKRGWHQGTLKRLSSGKYQIWISLPNGERKSKVCKSEAECNRWAIQMQANPLYAN